MHIHYKAQQEAPHYHTARQQEASSKVINNIVNIVYCLLYNISVHV